MTVTGTEIEMVVTREIEKGIRYKPAGYSLILQIKPHLLLMSHHILLYHTQTLTHAHSHNHTLHHNREWGDRDRGGYSRNNNSNNNSSAGVNPVRDALVVS